MSTIYIITNNIDGKVYIGQTHRPVQERWNQHVRESKYARSSSKYLYKAIKKHGIENFSFEVLEHITKDIDESAKIQALNKLEIYYISVYDSANPKHGYNSHLGGINYKVSDHTRKRLSESHKGIKYSEESKVRKSISGKQKHLTKIIDQYGTIWDGIANTATILGCNKTSIIKAIKRNGSIYGFKFRYHCV
jgi:group I intron endonuclease